jgi:hypothetical protein
MTHAEFLDKMVALERAINDLSKSLENELFDHSDMDINNWMIAHSAVELAKGMTYTKVAISNIHEQVFGK